MKTYNKILGAIALAACLSFTQANAAITLLNTSGTAILHDQGDTTVFNWLSNLASSHSLPAPKSGVRVDTTGPNNTSGPDTESILLTGHDYLVLHWGGQPYTGNGHTSDQLYTWYEQAYYIGGTTGSVSFGKGTSYGLPSEPLDANHKVGGLSSYTLYTAVPEPSTVIAGALMLLPFSISTLRRMRKNRVA